jgi:hypothetical protein
MSADDLLRMADMEIGTDNETAQVFATMAIANQLARIVDVLEHAFGTPPSWPRVDA